MRFEYACIDCFVSIVLVHMPNPPSWHVCTLSKPVEEVGKDVEEVEEDVEMGQDEATRTA